MFDFCGRSYATNPGLNGTIGCPRSGPGLVARDDGLVAYVVIIYFHYLLDM